MWSVDPRRRPVPHGVTAIRADQGKLPPFSRRARSVHGTTLGHLRSTQKVEHTPPGPHRPTAYSPYADGQL